MRPKILISPYICKSEFNGEINYFFKFVNASGFEIYDVSVEPTFFKPVGAVDGKNLRSTDIPLVDDFFSYMPKNKNNDDYNLHAQRVRTIENLEQSWTDPSSYIRITVMARHSISGLNKVFTQEFNSTRCIVEKDFCSGNDLNVI